MTGRADAFVVRVLKAGTGTTAGVGFVVDDRQLLTCAHVVNAALGRERNDQREPDEGIRLFVEFPLLDTTAVRQVEVVHWSPPPKSGAGGSPDVAGLALVGEGLPAGAAPARLSLEAQVDATAGIFGYPGRPPRRDNGAWSRVEIRRGVGGGLLQVDTTADSSIRAQPGYSGSPVVLSGPDDDVVVGMLGVASTEEGIRDAYAIPLSVMARAWPEGLGRLLTPACPYKGLAAFTAEDAAVGRFVGREAEVRQLHLLIREQPTMVVIGASGVGKSSLVSAGLATALTSEGWTVVQMRPGNDPLHALARTLHTVDRPHDEPSSGDVGERLAELASRGLLATMDRIAVARDARLLLVVDQLEEVFAPGVDPRVRTAFLDAILPEPAAARPSSEVRVVATLRSDFSPTLLDMQGFDARLNGRVFLVTPMSPASLLRVVVEPAEELGVRYEAGLAAEIARDAGSTPAALPLLEFALTELWGYQRGGRLTGTHYRQLGGVSGALNRHAERVYERLAADTDPETIRRVLLTMIHTRGGADHAASDPAGRDAIGPYWPVVERLAADRLVVIRQGSGRTAVAELAHETLIRHWERLRAWVDEDAEFLMWRSSMTDRAREEDLLSEAKLAEAERWTITRANDVPPPVTDLVTRSRAAISQRVAELAAAQRSAEARRLAANAELILARRGSTVVALGVAAEAVRTEHVVETDMALRHALALVPVFRFAVDHDGPVLAVAFSPDGRLLATAGTDGSVRVVRTDTGGQLHRIEHDDQVPAVIFSPDGQLLATAGAGGSVRVIRVDTGEELRHTDPPNGPGAVAFSPDGRLVATVSDLGSVQIIRVDTGEHVGFMDRDNSITVVAFSPDGQLLAAAGTDRSTRIVRVDTGEVLHRVEHRHTVRGLAFGSDGHLLAATSDDGSAWLVQVDTGERLAGIDNESWVYALAFSPDGQLLATASDDGSIRVVRIGSDDRLPRIDHHGIVKAMRFSPDGHLLATAGDDGSVRVVRIDTGDQLHRVDHRNTVRAVSFSPDGRLLATASDDGSAWVVRIDTGQQLPRIDHDRPVLAVTFSPDGRLLATAGWAASIRVVRLDTGEHLHRVDHDGTVREVAFSPDSQLLAATHYNGSLLVVRMDTGEQVHRIDHGGTVQAVTLSADGRLLATGGGDGSIRVVRVDTGEQVHRIERHGIVRTMTFSPDGQVLATAGYGNSVRLVRVETGEQPHHIHHDGDVNALRFSPDGRVLATAGSDGSVRIVRLDAVDRLHRIDHEGTVNTLVFSPDGHLLATASDDRSARVIRVETGEELHRVHHDGAVRAVSFSPDGRFLATAGRDGSARVARLDTGEQLHHIDHEGTVNALAFSPDGRLLATAGNDNSAHVSYLDVELLLAEARRRMPRPLTPDERRRYLLPEVPTSDDPLR